MASIVRLISDLRSQCWRFFHGGAKFILDTDAGADDAIAMLLMLRYEAFSSKIKVVGITCSYGNVNKKQVETNVLRTLTVAARCDIPVYSGAENGYIEPFSTDNFFGSDGFGDAKFDEEIIAKVDKSKHASVALVDLVNEHSGNINIITLGPLTNIGLAIALDSNFTKHVKHFYVMGSSVAGVGNHRPNVEFNFAADPESNLVLLNATAESQITLLPWESVVHTLITKNWRINVFGKNPSPFVKFMNKIEAVSLSKSNQWIAADALLAACVIDQSLITSKILRNVQAVTNGQARGSVLVDYNMNTGRLRNAQIIQTIDENRYKNVLLQYLTCE